MVPKGARLDTLNPLRLNTLNPVQFKTKTDKTEPSKRLASVPMEEETCVLLHLQDGIKLMPKTAYHPSEH
eukprot:scaffold264552_cov15-Tisochrysis_lutea.AAC.1